MTFGGLRWHNFYTKLCGDHSAGSEVEMETHMQYGDLIRLNF